MGVLILKSTDDEKVKKKKTWGQTQGNNFRNPLFRKVFLEEEKGYALVLLIGHIQLCQFVVIVSIACLMTVTHCIFAFFSQLLSIMQEDLFFLLAICNFSWGYTLTPCRTLMTDQGDHSNLVEFSKPLGLLEQLTDAWVTQRQPHHRKPNLNISDNSQK